MTFSNLLLELPDWAMRIVLPILIVMLVLLIVLIIVLCVRGSKKKSAKKTSKNSAPAKTASVKTEEKKESEKPASKPTQEKAEEKPANKVYHISKRKDDGMWQIKAAGGARAIKLFKTQKEAIDYGKALAEKQDASIMIHKEDGSFRKLTY